MLKLKGQRLLDAFYNFFASSHYLKEKLQVVLAQLPANFTADDKAIENLVEHTERLKKKYGLDFRLAVELRHESWFTPKVLDPDRKILNKSSISYGAGLLSNYNIAHVINSAPKHWPTHKEVTADFAYIRFHGTESLYASAYSDKELNEWADFIKTKLKKCRQVYVYFNNDLSAKAIENARYLQRAFST